MLTVANFASGFFLIIFPQAPDFPENVNSIFLKSTSTFETQGAPHASMTPIANEKKVIQRRFFTFC
jgi:hypothetical protein